jgi:hypothetical protein
MADGTLGEPDSLLIASERRDARCALDEVSLEAGTLIRGKIVGTIVDKALIELTACHDVSLTSLRICILGL